MNTVINRIMLAALFALGTGTVAHAGSTLCGDGTYDPIVGVWSGSVAGNVFGATINVPNIFMMNVGGTGSESDVTDFGGVLPPDYNFAPWVALPGLVNWKYIGNVSGVRTYSVKFRCIVGLPNGNGFPIGLTDVPFLPDLGQKYARTLQKVTVTLSKDCRTMTILPGGTGAFYHLDDIGYTDNLGNGFTPVTISGGTYLKGE